MNDQTQRAMFTLRAAAGARAAQAKLQAENMRMMSTRPDGTCRTHVGVQWDVCPCDKRVNVYNPLLGIY